MDKLRKIQNNKSRSLPSTQDGEMLKIIKGMYQGGKPLIEQGLQ